MRADRIYAAVDKFYELLRINDELLLKIFDLVDMSLGFVLCAINHLLQSAKLSDVLWFIAWFAFMSRLTCVDWADISLGCANHRPLGSIVLAWWCIYRSPHFRDRGNRRSCGWSQEHSFAVRRGHICGKIAGKLHMSLLWVQLWRKVICIACTFGESKKAAKNHLRVGGHRNASKIVSSPITNHWKFLHLGKIVLNWVGG